MDVREITAALAAGSNLIVSGPRRTGKPYGDADRLTKRMRAIFQRTTGVSYLFAGSFEHMMRDLFTPSHRALHQFGGFHALRPTSAAKRSESPVRHASVSTTARSTPPRSTGSSSTARNSLAARC